MKNKPYTSPRLTPLEPTDPRAAALAAELGAKSLSRRRRFRCPCGVGSTQGEEHPASYSGASCLACGGSVKAFVEETSRAVVVCPHGIASDAPIPCPMCIASTLLEGKKARELVHAIAMCKHPNASEEEELYTDSRFVVWCPDCGAKTTTSPGEPWKLPMFLRKAIALSLPSAATAEPAPPEPA